MATTAEIRQRVGEDLGLVSIGQSLEDQDKTRIDSAIDEAYERLRKEEIVSWAANGEVPTKIVPFYCLMIEESLLIAYSVPDNRFIRIKTGAGEGGVLAMKLIAGLNTQNYDSTDQPQDF